MMLPTNWKIGPDLLLWLLISLMLVMSQPVTGDSCPDMPSISIIQPFEAQIQAFFSHESVSVLIKEYFQPAEVLPDTLTGTPDPELGAVIQTQNGEQVHVITNYTSPQERLYIADGLCNTRKLLDEKPENAYIFSKDFIFSTKHILQITGDAICISNSNDSIRGIEAMHFQKQLKDVVIDFYFTRDNWTTEDDYTKPVPLRIEFSGVSKQTGQNFSNYFDYFYFKYVDSFTFEERSNAFEIPPGAYCAGRKDQSPIPDIPLSYSVTIEFVNPAEGSVKVSKLWVDSQNMLIRRDFHPVSYSGAGRPVTEIYNYLTGTVYTRDNILLNCSYNALSKAATNDDDILQHVLDTMNSKASGMVDTLKTLQLDKENTYYNGQRTLRNVDCNVFISMRSVQMETGGSKNVTFEYYFMSDDWKLLPDKGGAKDARSNIPMMLEVSYNHNGNKMNYFYNFFDFSDVVSYTDFDTSACYNQTKDIVLKITFKGQYLPSLSNAFKKAVHAQIADNSGLPHHRVQHIHLEYDDDFVFVFASIIDPAPPETLFTLHENKMIYSKKQRYLAFKGTPMSLCATSCVQDNYCNGFELTSDLLCTLTKMKFSEEKSGSQLIDNKGTNFYARTMMLHTKWQSNLNVWNSLFRNVNNRILSFTLQQPIANETYESYEYTSYYIELIKGEVSNIIIPILEKQVHYHAEITSPTYEETAYHEVWYDDLRKMMRLDQYIYDIVPPFYTPGILTTIHDYNTGVAYYLNKDLRNCTVLPISNTSVDASMQKVANRSVVRMKTPQEFLYINSQFQSVGQKTVRGILCDVYETVLNDYIVPGRSTPSETTLRYYVANEEEHEETDEEDKDDSELVMLEVISDSVSYYAIHSFFDFNQVPISLDVFDVKDCYEKTTDYMFQIRFQGDSVEPAIENPHEFIQIAQVNIANMMTVELLRIQEPVIEYDDKYVYFTAALISFPPIKGDVKVTKPPLQPLVAIGKLKDQVVAGYLFVNLTRSTKISYKAVSLRDDIRSTDTGILQMENNLMIFSISTRDSTIVDSKVLETFVKMSVDDCADLCLALGESCNGFGFCMNQGDCYLTGEHPDTHPHNLKNHKGCLVFNRGYIKQYNKKAGRSMVLKGDKSVDALDEKDCAKQCTVNKDFLCEAFEYCNDMQECTLSKVHTMDIPDDQISLTTDCDIYSRKYISQFHVSRNHAVKMVNNEILSGLSAEQCAKVCMEMESYSCSDFDYCQNTTECRLVYKDVKRRGQVSFEKSAVCDHYTRIAGTFKEYHGTSSEKVYGKADFVRVAFILLFCGLALGVIGMFIYIRRRKRIGL